MNMTMRKAFQSGIEKLRSETRNAAKFIVKGPDEEMFRAEENDFVLGDKGVEIGHEFIVGWEGILVLEVTHGAMFIMLNDGKTLDIEVVPE